MAAITTAAMLIPQAMAYAMLAGLPPIVGLNAAIVPPLAYALLGSSRHLSIGPTAVDSLLVASAVATLSASQMNASPIVIAALLALMVGVLQVALGGLRFGFVVNFLSQPVTTGFVSAAAVLIAISQLWPFIGMGPEAKGQWLQALTSGKLQLPDVHPPTLLIGFATLAVLAIARKLTPRFPSSLLALMAAAVVVRWGELGTHGIATVGRFNAGIPSWQLPSLSLEHARVLFPHALTLALVGFMEAISIGKSFAQEHGDDIRPNRELLALGAANLAGGIFRGYPVSAGFSRTAVHVQAGAQTKLAGALASACVLAIALILAPLFATLPMAALAALILLAVTQLIKPQRWKRLWQVDRKDFLLALLTFVATLVTGIQEGLIIGIGASLLVFVVRTTRPHVAVLGQLPGREVYRNVKRFPSAQTFPGVLIVRIDAQFYFGNVSFLKETLRTLEAQMTEPLRAVIIDASSVNQLDSSAESALREILQNYRTREIRLMMAGVKGPVRDMMARSGFTSELGRSNMTFRVHDAVQAHVYGVAVESASGDETTLGPAGNQDKEDSHEGS